MILSFWSQISKCLPRKPCVKRERKIYFPRDRGIAKGWLGNAYHEPAQAG